MRKLWVPLLVIAILSPSICIAEYIATGVYEGEVCSGFVIKVCKLERLDAVKRGGQFYHINKVWDKVDSYRDGRCWIRFGKGSLGILDRAPDFYQYDKNQELQKVGKVSYVTFKCKKR